MKSKPRTLAKKIDKFAPGSNVAVEIPLRDGSVSLLVGHLEKIDAENIVLSTAAFVKDTGRRTQFFAGQPDSNCEIEVYNDDVMLPRTGAILYAWPHALLTVQR